MNSFFFGGGGAVEIFSGQRWENWLAHNTPMVDSITKSNWTITGEELGYNPEFWHTPNKPMQETSRSDYY